jgi:hypothetical protein
MQNLEAQLSEVTCLIREWKTLEERNYAFILLSNIF